MTTSLPSLAPGTIRFLPIGDSYTIGQGIDPKEIWPVLLTERLKEAGINIELIGNPARTGWTTQDAIKKELPIFESERPTFSTLLIGVNDWVQGVDAGMFRERLSFLLDRMQATLPPNRLIVITIPDFSVTPAGSSFGDPSENAEGIRSFNQIIQEEAIKRSLPVVDLFTLSQAMGTDSSLVADDGLHPSAKEHLLWLEQILPVALKTLAQR
ncbi:MAG: SGNH/GDSL hydrolase family protein [Candidatus Peribacteraceae bacterium]|nr:SGNH/GDSL hydrolase family protein [Candidatus Peribacteraceae bacterium]